MLLELLTRFKAKKIHKVSSVEKPTVGTSPRPKAL